jgi:predicted transcriptional regulator
MTKKELMMKAIEELPEDAEFDDAIDRLLYLAGIERGLADVEAGRVISHKELLEQIKTWRK